MVSEVAKYRSIEVSKIVLCGIVNRKLKTAETYLGVSDSWRRKRKFRKVLSNRVYLDFRFCSWSTQWFSKFVTNESFCSLQFAVGSE